MKSTGWAGFLSTAVRMPGRCSPIIWRAVRCVLVATKATLFLRYNIFFPPGLVPCFGRSYPLVAYDHGALILAGVQYSLIFGLFPFFSVFIH